MAGADVIRGSILALETVARPEPRTPPTKELLIELFVETLARLSLDRLIPQKVLCRGGVLHVGDEQINLRLYERVVVIAFGKAAYRMTESVAAAVQPITLSGVISGPSVVERSVPGFACFRGGHPYPNAESFKAGEAVIRILRQVTSRDLVLYLLSGGGSAICEKPLFKDISLQDLQEFYRLLVTCGGSIVDVNFIRKHFSAIKGGRLTQLASPARQVTIYVSDAPPGNPSNVASGPTMPDESSVEDCFRIVQRLGLLTRLPLSIRRKFEEKMIPETPKPGAEVFRKSSWHCLLAPEHAVAALAERALAEGWVVQTDMSIDDDCPLEKATGQLLLRLETLRQTHPQRTVAIVTGGEYSCPVNGDGVGGRNQAFVLHCIPKIAGKKIAALSAGTDGIDGISPAAGAVADGSSLDRARQLGIDPFLYSLRADSHGFFARLGDVVMTGPTGNNVRDLRILVNWSSRES